MNKQVDMAIQKYNTANRYYKNVERLSISCQSLLGNPYSSEFVNARAKQDCKLEDLKLACRKVTDIHKPSTVAKWLQQKCPDNNQIRSLTNYINFIEYF
jgi:hypothetical protein